MATIKITIINDTPYTMQLRNGGDSNAPTTIAGGGNDPTYEQEFNPAGGISGGSDYDLTGSPNKSVVKMRFTVPNVGENYYSSDVNPQEGAKGPLLCRHTSPGGWNPHVTYTVSGDWDH